MLSLEGDLHLVFHLMIAGRLRWKKRGAAIPAKRAHAAFDFENGTLLLTEASPRKRATLHVVRAPRASPPTIRAGSRCWRPTSPRSAPPSLGRATR